MDTHEKIWKMAEINKSQKLVGDRYIDSLNHTRIGQNHYSLDIKKAVEESYMDTMDHEYIGQNYIPFSITTLDGKKITNKNCTGKITLFVFFTQACNICLDFSTLNNLYKTLKANPSFQLIAITFEKEGIKDFIKKHDIRFPIAFVSNSSELEQMDYNNSEPSFILLDKNGKIALLKDEGIGIANTYNAISSIDLQKIIGMLS